MKHLRASLLGLVLIGLAACGSDPEPQATSADPAATAKPVPPVQKGTEEERTARMARAVGNGKPGAAVDIRYEIKGKPSVGTPLEMEIALIPNAGVDAMEATITGMDGISVTGPLTASFAQVEPGKPYTHKITVLPQANGVYYVTVAINAQIRGNSLGRTYAIPFVVGTEPVSKKPAPAKDAKGEAIQSMPAEESSG